MQEAAGSASAPSTSRKQESSDSETGDDDLEEMDAPSSSSGSEAACQLPQSLPDGPPSSVAGSFYLVRLTTWTKHGCKIYIYSDV